MPICRASRSQLNRRPVFSLGWNTDLLKRNIHIRHNYIHTCMPCMMEGKGAGSANASPSPREPRERGEG
jgi:hypothetical protein